MASSRWLQLLPRGVGLSLLSFLHPAGSPLVKNQQSRSQLFILVSTPPRPPIHTQGAHDFACPSRHLPLLLHLAARPRLPSSRAASVLAEGRGSCEHSGSLPSWQVSGLNEGFSLSPSALGLAGRRQDPSLFPALLDWLREGGQPCQVWTDPCRQAPPSTAAAPPREPTLTPGASAARSPSTFCASSWASAAVWGFTSPTLDPGLCIAA